jgi:hypothetical protein
MFGSVSIHILLANVIIVLFWIDLESMKF